jgi:hypothetical protein
MSLSLSWHLTVILSEALEMYVHHVDDVVWQRQCVDEDVDEYHANKTLLR